MFRGLLLLLICCIVVSFPSESKAQAAVYNFEAYSQRTQPKNDTLYVVNFWATWCKPCIEELPYFQQLADSTAGLKVKIILVSMDTKSRALAVQQFMEKNAYTSEYFILSAGNPNVWINKIDPAWSGAIPVTLLYRNGEKLYFLEGDYADFASLQQLILSHLK